MTTGGEKFACPGYKTENPGQLSDADKVQRGNWKSITQLRNEGYSKKPDFGYYYENGVKKFGERHPNYGS